LTVISLGVVLTTKTKTKKTKKPKWFRTEEFELNDGEILVYRSNKSGKFWSVRIWVKEEKKYYVKGLGTKDKEKSIELSKNHYKDIHSKLRTGVQVFDKTLEELVELYLLEQSTRIRQGDVGGGKLGITEGRYGTIKTQLNKHLMGFLGSKTRLSKIGNHSFKYKYYRYRKDKSRKVTDGTIINERVTINSLFKFGVDKTLIQQRQVPVWEEMKKEKPKGESLTLGEWKQVYMYMRTWDKDVEDVQEKTRREIVRHFILVLCNTGLRFGECRYLKWKNIKLIKEKDGNTTSVIDVKISKTGGRTGVIGRRGEYFKRLKKLSNFTKDNDWVFCDNETGKQIGKTTLYRLWKEILDNTSLKDNDNYTYYTLRHTYCTFRLLSGVDIYLLSQNMGTSIYNIENTYGHVKLLDKRHQLTGGKKLTESDRVLIDV
jgi:integrase